MKKCLAILTVPILLLALACKPAPETTTTTDTAVTSGTDTVATTETIAPPLHEIDHYKLWKVKSIPFERDVKLKGQFDTAGAWEARVRSIEYLGNPVEKNGEKILYLDRHLVAYRIEAKPQDTRIVVIENQFRKGEHLRIGNPAWLLLPASKSLDAAPGDVPKDADHYACYLVERADPIPGTQRLVDQFDRRRKKLEEVRELSAELFCVPVSKDGGPIFKEREHLTIYRFLPPDPYPILAATRDQFGERKLSVEQSELLAVPTIKMEVRKP